MAEEHVEKNNELRYTEKTPVSLDPHLRDPIRERFPDELELVGENEEFERMPLVQRIQHLVLMICFFTLVATGLPLIFRDNALVKALFNIEGGFEVRSITHRIAGVGLILVSIFQVFYVLFDKRGRSDFLAILPRPKDAFDAIHTFMHNLGLMAYFKKKGYFAEWFERYPWLSFEEPPRFGRYSFVEKFEYLALIWGNAVMIATGLMMWFVEVSLAIFPKWVLDVVRVIHGFEALLALLSIVIWHMYNVHLNPDVFPMSKVWLTGKISREHFRAHHPLEYEEMLLERRKQKQAQNRE